MRGYVRVRRAEGIQRRKGIDNDEERTDKWFDRETSGAEVCTYDPEHDGPLDELPEDVSAISGFGVAALLIVIRRTLIEKLQQFTYVGDVVIAVNPYMYLPKMVSFFFS